MSDMKTYCIGRYLVDLPADAQINGQSYRYRFGRIATDTSAGTVESFQNKMEARETDLKTGNQKDGYKLTDVRRPASSIWIFELYRKLLLGPSTGFEAHVWDHGTIFSMEETGYEPSHFGQVLAELQTNLLPNLHARRTDTIPSQPGFCLQDGFITSDGTVPQFEYAGISFKFAQWPGVLVSIETMTVTKLGEPSLLQRIDSRGVPDAFKNLISHIQVLRRGQRIINGRPGEEILATLPTDGGYRLHQFQWEAQGTEIGSGLRPTITVELESGMTRENGVPARPRLTDEQAIALFDLVADSVRLRPVGTSEVSGASDSSKAPLGTLAQTGTPCPQTGWWTCPEATAHDIEGGGRQRFEAGVPMPMAQVLGKKSLVDRMTGRQQKHAVNTVWRLVAYDANSDIGHSNGDRPEAVIAPRRKNEERPRSGVPRAARRSKTGRPTFQHPRDASPSERFAELTREIATAGRRSAPRDLPVLKAYDTSS